MSFLGQYKVYSQLSDEQMSVIRHKLIEGTHTPDDWLVFLEPIVAFDSNVDASRKTLGIGCAITGVLLVVGFFLIAVIGPVLVLIAIALAVALGIVAYRQSRINMPNNLRLFIFPLLSFLREEMETGEEIYLKLDLRGRLISEKEGWKPRVSGRQGNDKFFRDDWMVGRAQLADGSRLDWSIVDYTRERKRTKKSASGKWKTKTKHKIKTLIDASLGLPSEYYVPAASKPTRESVEKIALKKSEKRNTVRVRRAVISTDKESVLDLGQFLAAVGHCYSQVTAAKPGPK